jgi:hypothetical protein
VPLLPSALQPVRRLDIQPTDFFSSTVSLTIAICLSMCSSKQMVFYCQLQR